MAGITVRAGLTRARRSMRTVAVVPLTAMGLVVATPDAVAGADNKRLNDGVVVNVYTLQHQAGCTNDVKRNPALQRAAEWHARDVVRNRSLDGDLGSDGTTAQDRARNGGYPGTVAQTVAINPALAINGLEVLRQWYFNPAYYAIISNCAHSEIGVWSENSLDRSVVVAVFGQPAGH